MAPEDRVAEMDRKLAEALEDWRYLVDEGHSLQVRLEDLERAVRALALKVLASEWRKDVPRREA